MNNKKDKINEALDKMKRLNEFHFKSSGSQREMPISENPVKFNEVGDKYKDKPKSDYPNFSEYLDEVILDEAEPEEDNDIEQPQQAQTPQGQNNPSPEQQPAQPATQEPAPQAEPVAPAPEPIQQTPAPQEPAPVAATEPTVVDNSGGLDSHIDKTDALMSQLAIISQKLSALDVLPEKVAHLSSEVENIKNPSLDDEMEMISKNSYPYNIKLSDYWDWEDKENPEPEEEQEFSATPEEIESYNKDDIKKSFNPNIG